MDCMPHKNRNKFLSDLDILYFTSAPFLISWNFPPGASPCRDFQGSSHTQIYFYIFFYCFAYMCQESSDIQKWLQVTSDSIVITLLT